MLISKRPRSVSKSFESVLWGSGVSSGANGWFSVSVKLSICSSEYFARSLQKNIQYQNIIKIWYYGFYLWQVLQRMGLPNPSIGVSRLQQNACARFLHAKHWWQEPAASKLHVGHDLTGSVAPDLDDFGCKNEEIDAWRGSIRLVIAANCAYWIVDL